jgi:hypothetical protein
VKVHASHRSSKLKPMPYGQASTKTSGNAMGLKIERGVAVVLKESAEVEHRDRSEELEGLMYGIGRFVSFNLCFRGSVQLYW